MRRRRPVRVQPGRRDARGSAETGTSAVRRAHAEAAGRKAFESGSHREPRGVHQRRLAARRGGVGARRHASWITIRDAATLQQIGSPIEPDGFAGSFLSQLWTDPSIALTPDGRSLVTDLGRG